MTPKYGAGIYCAHRNLHIVDIFRGSQATLSAMANPKGTSILVWEYRKELRVLADVNR